MFRSMVIFCMCSLLPLFSAGEGYTVRTVPDPKAGGTGYVSNPDGILSAAETTRLNGMLADLEKAATVQIAVVAVNSIGDATPKEFATDLFKHWQIGQRGKDNGLLLLVVVGQRRWEIETGYGLEGVLPDAKCAAIGRAVMLPRFKRGAYGEGIIAGMEAVRDILTTKEALQEITASRSDTGISGIWRRTVHAVPIGGSRAVNNVLGVYALIALIAAALAFCIVLIPISLPLDPYMKYRLLRPLKLLVWAILIPIPFAFIYMWSKGALKKFRDAPRKSPRTGKSMRKLNDKEEDVYLKKGQIDEEKIRSIDYDVWASDEENDILILRYPTWFSSYSKCPKCGAKTYRMISDTVTSQATYESSGSGVREFDCASCSHHESRHYTIPMKTQSSSSSSSGSSGGSSSWGGGRSGGGGAGGSW